MTDLCKLDITGIPRELSLLAAIISNNKEALNDVIQSDIDEMDWDLFIKLADHHRIYPIVYKKAKSMDLPKHVLNDLFRKYQKNIFWMLHLSAETERLAMLFQDNSIPALFLKGPALAEDLYNEISLRTSSDLDILIPFNKLDIADKYLTEFGYVKNDYIHTVLNDWKWRHHHFTYFHFEKKIKAEIHWRLNPGPAKEPPFRDLWKRKRISHSTDAPVFLLGKEDLFLFLVSHGARHGWSRLRWLADIDRLLGKRLDVKMIKELLKKYQYLQTGGQAIFLSSQFLLTPLTDEMKKLTETKRSRELAQEALFYLRNQVNLHTDPVPAEVAIYHRHHLYHLMSFQQKILFLLSVLYPYPIDTETCPLPKVLHFLYFPLHPVLWAWRRMRRQALP